MAQGSIQSAQLQSHLCSVSSAKLQEEQIVPDLSVHRVLLPVVPTCNPQADLNESKRVYLKKLLCIENIH